MSGPARVLLILVMIGGVALVAGGMIVLLKGEEEVAPPSPDATGTTERPDTTAPRTQPETHRPSGGPPIVNTQNPPFLIRRDPQLPPRYAPGRSQDRSRSKIRAIVRDQDGKSIKRAEIYVSTSLTPSAAEQNMKFRHLNKGIYESRGLVEGHYYIRCRAQVHPDPKHKNFAIATAEADVGYGQVKVVTFTLPTRGRLSVRGSITTGSGAAGGIDVILRSDSFEAHTTSAPDGSYQVEKLPAGTYMFRALYLDGTGATSDLFSAELGLQMDLNYSPHLEIGTLELTIAPQSGVKVAGLRVEFLRPDPTEGEEPAVFTSVASGKTDRRGVLKIKYVPNGLFKVVIAGLVAEPDQISIPTVRTISAREPRAPGE